MERKYQPMTETRMMDLNALCVYLSLGRNRAMDFGKECGAEKHIGRRCLYDKKVVDEYLDNLCDKSEC